MKFAEFISEKIKTSAIFGALDKFSSYLYEKLSESIVGRIFTSYGNIETKFQSSLFYSLFKKKPSGRKSIFGRLKYSISVQFEKSTLLNLLSVCKDYLLKCRLKVYGIFSLSFGIYSVLIYIFKKYAFYLENASESYLYVGIGLIIAALLFLPHEQSLAQALLSSRIMKFILVDTLGIRAETFSSRKDAVGKSNIAFIIGIVCGTLTYFVSPVIMLAFIFAVICVFIVLSYPEAGVLMMIFITPFITFLSHPSIILAGVVLLTTLSYVIKLIRGKRTVKFEFVDIIIVAFMLLLIFGGIVSIGGLGSAKISYLLVCLMLGYFLVVNLMHTKLWLRRCIGVLVGSSALVAIYGIYMYFTNRTNEDWIDTSMFGDISGRAISTFENPNMLAEYLIIVLPFALAMMLYVTSARKKILYALAGALAVLCLVYTWSRSAWLGIIAGLMLFFLIYSKKAMYILIIGVCALPFVSFLLPQTLITRFTSIGNLGDSSTMYRVYLWKAVLSMIKDFFGGGIGVGEPAFTSVYPLYTYIGIESAPHSHSIYFQITLELGIVGIIVFLLAMFLMMQQSFDYIKKSDDKRSAVMVAAGMSGIAAALIQGAADYIWYNYRVFFIFWIVIGIVCAYRRLGYETEQTYGIYKDESSAYVDIKLP